ncbi:Riboflavin synthase [compost metagenome]
MFTGLIEEVGTLIARRGDELVIGAPMIAPTLKLGDSVAVNGICLTATSLGGDRFTADVSATTFDATTAGNWQKGRKLNLERAMALGDRLGGHLVSGHVDAVGALQERRKLGEAWKLTFEMPEALSPFLVPKGSIAIDGTSLTVNEVERRTFTVTVIPHTAEKTLLLDLAPGDPVNLEADMLAKYVQRMLSAYVQPAAPKGGLTWAKLAECGFMDS